MSTEKWAADYQNYTDNPPPEGTILRCYGNEDARLDLELVEGKPPFLYGRVYVPHIVGQELGWFLQPFDSDAAYGWKCILLPKAREEALRRLGITEKRLRVKALKIVRYSRTGSSILCEIAEYCAPLVEESKLDEVPKQETSV
jgi:hypothetical protein